MFNETKTMPWEIFIRWAFPNKREEKVVRMPKSAKLRYIYYIDNTTKQCEYNFILELHENCGIVEDCERKWVKYAQLE